ncbi:hypothetical protein SAMN05443999_108156 [Roseovarius azorensis]|uniref:Uncharacterized protein n=1 Tax=Roseovarius azorensis TaxID=1287727 RepID=A0A1H7TEU4_9RHOB|nr:hypothetical protein [Roseovarius azorensis]SEL83400.1 hypothetical protein SAMN05443999_108156 [Roseovarius azorensis]
MSHLTEKLADQTWRHSMGRRFEAMTDEIFQVIRWILLVGFANYLAKTHGTLTFSLTYWMLAALLFGYIASRFLLRPEVPFLGNPTARLPRLIQSALNFLLCVVVFALTLWAVGALTQAIADYRSLR